MPRMLNKCGRSRVLVGSPGARHRCACMECQGGRENGAQRAVEKRQWKREVAR